MNTKTNTLSISTMLSAALFLTLSASQAVETTQAPDGVTKTKIKVNGQSSDMFLVDGDTMGSLNASKDQVANTSGLDFSYATPDATDPDLVILIQGAGEIPNSGFTATATTAHLSVTTPFRVNRCVVNIVTAEFTCADIAPSRSI